MAYLTIPSIDQIPKILHTAPLLVVFKHSSTCPVSAAANTEVLQFMEHTDIPVYRIIVQTERVVSDAFTKRSGVRHESPQVLMYKDGKVLAHASHWHITADWLTEHTK
jgi:bacillithiol system protein YtxJ